MRRHRLLSMFLAVTMLPLLSFSSISAETDDHVVYVSHNIATGVDTYTSIAKEPPDELKDLVLSEPGYSGTDSYNSIMPFTVIGAENRKKVTNYKVKPYSSICRISVKWPNGASTYGTAWLFKNNSAVTAGHCIFNKSRGGWASSVTVYPGYNESNRPYGSATATDMGIATPYSDNKDNNYDYGLLKLSSSIGNQCGWLGYTYNGGAVNSSIKLIGYAGDLDSKYQYESTGKITSLTANRLAYDADAGGGQSGGPLFVGSTVVGIHTQSATNINRGKRIHYDMFEWMKNW